MSRGGFGGGAGGIGRMNGQALPFDVDGALEDQVLLNSYQNDDWTNSLFPPINVRNAPPASAHEKKLVQHTREINEERRNGPFFLGDAIGKRDASTFNAFEDVKSYSNKKAKRFKNMKPTLDNMPIVREVLPDELQDLFDESGDGDPTEISAARAKQLAFLKKQQKDKLAKFDEGADLDPAADEDDEEAKDPDADGEDGVDAPSDNNFSEDDSDMGDDYNAEKYFSDGADDGDDGGDDDGGGDDW